MVSGAAVIAIPDRDCTLTLWLTGDSGTVVPGCGTYGIHLMVQKGVFLIQLHMRWKRGNRLRLADENGASPCVREILADVRESFGVPVVPLLYRAYAVFPRFLELHWETFRPVVKSRQFFLLGARLAAECYTRAHNYFAVGNLDSNGLASSGNVTLPLGQVLDYYQYLDPLLLLIAAAQVQAFEGPVGDASSMAEPAQHPTFPVGPHLLSDEESTPPMQRIWDERRRLLELAFTSDEHRALACWPEFYQSYWSALKSLIKSPLYTDCQYRMGESALKLARELPVALETTVPQLLEAGLDDQDMSSVARINDAFMQALTGLVLDVTFARIASEGGTHKGPRPEDEKPGKATVPTGTPIRAA
ncbi:MAG TPA: halocarboxylic acid dehydrogenase DehI family protein [Terriglobales bacterium]|nr:halocarboxylic acid dehydrogenase DehI family protein [Terriglobales bacterium]